jgi:hypothetical protein
LSGKRIINRFREFKKFRERERERVTAVFDVGCEGQRHNQTKRKEEGHEKLEVNGFHSLDSATCQNK